MSSRSSKSRERTRLLGNHRTSARRKRWCCESIVSHNNLSSGVASRRIWGDQNVWFLANNTILFGKTPLKAQNDCVLKIWGEWPLWPPPGYAYELERSWFQSPTRNFIRDFHLDFHRTFLDAKDSFCAEKSLRWIMQWVGSISFCQQPVMFASRSAHSPSHRRIFPSLHHALDNTL